MWIAPSGNDGELEGDKQSKLLIISSNTFWFWNFWILTIFLGFLWWSSGKLFYGFRMEYYWGDEQNENNLFFLSYFCLSRADNFQFFREWKLLLKRCTDDQIIESIHRNLLKPYFDMPSTHWNYLWPPDSAQKFFSLDSVKWSFRQASTNQLTTNMDGLQ